ncbi:Cytosolic sulfotransferase 12 [Bienertia sinuspersici]
MVVIVAKDTDIYIASIPKTGSTWLKSLLYSIVNRSNQTISESPLLTHHPHQLVYSLETDVYSVAFDYSRPHHLDELVSPRLLSTHVPYMSLPESFKTSNVGFCIFVVILLTHLCQLIISSDLF